MSIFKSNEQAPQSKKQKMYEKSLRELARNAMIRHAVTDHRIPRSKAVEYAELCEKIYEGLLELHTESRASANFIAKKLQFLDTKIQDVQFEHRQGSEEVEGQEA